MKTVSVPAQTQVNADQNRPIELYDVYLKTETLHFTDHHEAVPFWDPEGNAVSYLPIPIQRGEIQQDVNAKALRVTVRIDNVNQAMAFYAEANEIRGRRVSVRQVFLDAVASAQDAVFLMKNALIDSYTISEAWLEATLTSSIGSLNIEIPKWHYQLLCNRKFGDAGCSVDVNSSDNKKIKTTGAGSTQSVIQSSGFTEAADYFLDGELHIMSGPLAGQKRRIVASQSGQVTVQFGFTQAPASGITIHAYRGCDKSPSACLNRFNNKINFGGFDTIPQELVRR